MRMKHLIEFGDFLDKRHVSRAIYDNFLVTATRGGVFL